MTIQAPLHVQSLRLPHQGHGVDVAMAGLTPDALGYVDIVLEVDKVRQVMYPGPLERHLIAKTRPYRLEHRRLGPDQGVTAHAGLRGRDSRKGGFLDGGVAVAAVDAQLSSVDGV